MAKTSYSTLLVELAAARLSVLDAARTLPPDRLDEAFLGTWSVKDLLAHLIGWDITNLCAIQEMLEGNYPSFFQYYDTDWKSYNARLVQMHRVEPFSALLQAVERSHQQLLTFLQALPEETFLSLKVVRPGGKRTLAARTLLAAEARDERIHAAQVEAFFKNPGDLTNEDY